METKERITPEPVTQEQRLSFLVEAFKADSNEYRDLPTPRDTAGRQRVLRSLMNVRMPGELPEAVLRVQDDYLQDMDIYVKSATYTINEQLPFPWE